MVLLSSTMSTLVSIITARYELSHGRTSTACLKYRNFGTMGAIETTEDLILL